MKPAQNGTDVAAQIAKLVAEREDAAFERGRAQGWDEAVAAMVAAVSNMTLRQKQPAPTEEGKKSKPKKRRRTVRNEGPSPSRKIVLSAIKQNPGLLGA